MSKKQYKTDLKVQTVATLNAYELAHSTNHKDLINFIKDIDDALADWNFTMELYKHFAKLKKDYDAEIEADRVAV